MLILIKICEQLPNANKNSLTFAQYCHHLFQPSFQISTTRNNKLLKVQGKYHNETLK